MNFRTNIDFTIGPNTSLKHFPYSHFQRFCNVIISDVWEQVAARILNKKKTAPKFVYDDILTFRRSKRPAEEMMNCWKMDNPSFSDLMAILEEEKLLRALTFIKENVFSGRNNDVQKDSFDLNKEENIWDAKKCQENTENDYNNIRIPYNTLSSWTNGFNLAHLSQGGNFINSGGFSDVFLGVRGSEKVAVKRFKDSENKEQFENEAILFDCKHSNLVRLLHLSDDGPSLCLVYEFMEAGSLLDWLCDADAVAKLDKGARVKVASGTVSGLAHLHSKDIVHRDVKSANILLSGQMSAKLSDFGISKMLHLSGDTHVTTKTLVGTVVYMAPEYLYNQEVSTKMDMYSYGVVLLELIYGQPAYSEERRLRNIIDMFEDGVPVDACWSTAGESTISRSADANGKAVLDAMQAYLTRLISKKKHLRPSAGEVLEALLELQQLL